MFSVEWSVDVTFEASWVGAVVRGAGLGCKV